MAEIAELDEEAKAWVQFLEGGLKARKGRLSSVELARCVPVAFETAFHGNTSQEKLARALARGVPVREKMASEEGGTLSADEVARILRISKQSVLNQYHSGKLLGFRTEKQSAVRFPAWQLDGVERLAGLGDVLARLRGADALDDWGKIGFFLQGHRLSRGRRPLDLLREKKVAEVLKIADAYVE